MDAPTLSSRVTAVTVFRRGAQVTRTATLTRGEGGLPSTVRLEGLPLLLDDESLQVELHAEGTGQAPLAGEVRVTLAVPEPEQSLRPPTNEELKAAALALALAQQHQADLELMSACVSGLVPGARGASEEGKPPMPSPTEARLRVLDVRRERLEQLGPRLTEAAERTRQAQEHLQTLQERERRASQARNPRTFEARKAVVVGLSWPSEDGAAGHPVERLRLELRYFVPGARWAPSYVLRLDPSLTRGTIELRALVGQATGERWTDVALTLSTAHPQQWTELPELRSLRIGRAQPPPPKAGWRPPPTGTDQLYADFDRARAPTPSRTPARPVPPASSNTLTRAGVISGGLDLEQLRTLAMQQAEAQAHAAAGEVAVEREEMMHADAYVAREASSKKRTSLAYAPPAPGAPPMPMAPPQMMPPAAASVPRSASFGGMIGSALGGLLDGGGGAAPELLDMDDEEFDALLRPGTLLADRDQLEYGSLWLPPPDDPRRGQLQRADQAQRYQRLGRLPPEQITAALSRAEAARSQAAVLERREAPGGHRWAKGTDGFDYAYQGQAHVDLDCDGELHGLPLLGASLEAKPRYIAVPRETQDVFRVVVLRNPLDAPLLPGPVDVYLGGRFALASDLPVTPPRGRVELGLGVEQALKIARNVTFEEESSGLLKRHRDLEHRIRIDIKNRLTVAATVEVRERLPVTREGEGDIEVTERSVEPAWDEHLQHEPPLQGGRAWKVEVPAGGERALKASYAIRIPKDHELVGGNRREG
ncbi:DUF4139 domain-containing protein [Paraliomyxa miuraensis]|uniref:DUF4139 domain-containing protein n=1 Tax=Paraliomyxa miuraensis TaxID=376150 RepID=UPI00224EEFBD|nr:DUF4139 domain-containing protein [Paraliomyxa miuraensis]MCX4244526.1 DUF4139 domain-containing protein [Paraliomyxa miuraensis]